MKAHHLLLILLLICSVLAAGCATTPAPRPEIDMTKSKETMSTYIWCVNTAAKRYSLSDTTTTEATEAALGRCNSEFTLHKLAIREAFLTNTSNASAAMRDADALAEQTRESVRSRTMSQIVEHRSQKAQ